MKWCLESDPHPLKTRGFWHVFIKESSWKIRALFISSLGIYIWLKETISILKSISWVSGGSENFEIFNIGKTKYYEEKIIKK